MKASQLVGACAPAPFTTKIERLIEDLREIDGIANHILMKQMRINEVLNGPTPTEGLNNTVQKEPHGIFDTVENLLRSVVDNLSRIQGEQVKLESVVPGINNF